MTQYVDRRGVCKTCGHDHSFRPTLEDTKTSIDVIPKLFGKVKNVTVSA